MDWLGIIGTHVLWKKRLLALLDGTSQETLDPESISVDNNCALGKWIYGDGQSYASASTFETVRSMHAEFHRLAAQVVSLHKAGKKDEAEYVLQHEYSKLSERLKHRILALANEVKSSETTPRF
ncbi:MAG: CZB domain-containing protein [Thiobacillaceae bacterium]